MCFGNGIGFNYEGKFPARVLFEDKPGAFLVETDLQLRGDLIGYTKDTANIYISGASLPLPVMAELWQKPEEKLYSSGMQLREEGIVPAFPVTKHPAGMPRVAVPKPRV
ncbi:MAG: hypothetical protein IJ302_02625, partial [Clostridia bacterium]|nr:hypothetical protein [Clostridia bacterium]